MSKLDLVDGWSCDERNRTACRNPHGCHCREITALRIATKPQEVQVLDFFSQSVDAWGALEWFDRLAKAVREQDKAVVAGDTMTMETCRNVASSSAMRLVRDYEPLVRAALSLSRPQCLSECIPGCSHWPGQTRCGVCGLGLTPEERRT